MVTLDLKMLVVRAMEVVFTLIAFSLVASVGHTTDSFWTWCMFSWCFCFCVTILIVVLEATGLSVRLPISWEDFTAAFAMLATLMILSASIIYAMIFAKGAPERIIAATVMSFLAFLMYAIEVGFARAKPGEVSGFLSTIPGLLKVLEAFVACIIFICLDYNPYKQYPGLQWCVAVYSICFIFAMVVIIATVCRLLALFPAPFDKVLTVCNVLAALMYATAVVIWPVYSFKGNPRPPFCSISYLCHWNMLVVISFMTCLNLVVYIVDTVYSFRLVFIVGRQ